MSKIRFVVVDENTLGHIDPAQPNIIGILHASPIIGCSSMVRNDMDGWMLRPAGDEGLRPATRADFNTYRVSIEGYRRHDPDGEGDGSISKDNLS